MTVLTDYQIFEAGIISPYVAKSHAFGMSYGASSFGYDLRMDKIVKVMSQKNKKTVPTINTTMEDLGTLYSTFTIPDDGVFLLKPLSRCLVSTLELIKMPTDVVGITKPKSTLSRLGLEVASVVIEPNWTGNITLELFNKTDRNISLYPGMPICQLMFWRGEEPSVIYDGKYQGDKGISVSKVGYDPLY